MSLPLPRAIVEVAERLRAAQCEAWLVGEGLAALMLAKPGDAQAVARGGFELATDATPARLRALFPSAAVTRAAEGVLTLPTRAGPLDLAPLGAASIEQSLAARCFTVHAVALDPSEQRWIDPYDGRDAAACGRLSCVDPAKDVLAEAPWHAVRSARLVATTTLDPDTELEGALHEVRLGLGRATRDPIRALLRRELSTMLLGPRVGEAIALLRRTGLEAQLVKNAPPDAARIVGALPATLEWRWIGWLRGARANQTLRSLRCGQAFADHVLLLLDQHPLDRKLRPKDLASLERVLARIDASELATLFELRELETAADTAEDTTARAALDVVREGFERARQKQALDRVRRELVLDGAAVMQALGCEPGRRVGEALTHLAREVASGRTRNSTDELLNALAAWESGDAR